MVRIYQQIKSRNRLRAVVAGLIAGRPMMADHGYKIGRKNMKKFVYATLWDDLSDESEAFVRLYENPDEAAFKFLTLCGFAVSRSDTLIHYAKEHGHAVISGMQKFELIQLEIEINDGSDISDIEFIVHDNWDEYYPQGLVLARFEIGE